MSKPFPPRPERGIATTDIDPKTFEWMHDGYSYRVRIPRKNPVVEYWSRRGWIQLPDECTFPASMVQGIVAGLGLLLKERMHKEPQ